MPVQFQNRPTAAATQNNGQRTNGAAFGVGVRFGWPTERWAGVIVLMALGLLILIRFGFRGIGISGQVGGRVSL